jgi:hypothetical protein
MLAASVSHPHSLDPDPSVLASTDLETAFHMNVDPGLSKRYKILTKDKNFFFIKIQYTVAFFMLMYGVVFPFILAIFFCPVASECRSGSETVSSWTFYHLKPFFGRGILPKSVRRQTFFTIFLVKISLTMFSF